jgi:hypothetical protein
MNEKQHYLALNPYLPCLKIIAHTDKGKLIPDVC